MARDTRKTGSAQVPNCATACPSLGLIAVFEGIEMSWLSGANGSKSGKEGDPGESASGVPELRLLIEKLADRIAASDETNAAALQTINTQLTALSAQSRNARGSVSSAFATAFDRLDDAITDLANRVARADHGNETTTQSLTLGNIAADQPAAAMAGSETRAAAMTATAPFDEDAAPVPSMPEAMDASDKTAPSSAETATHDGDGFVADPDLAWSEDSAEALTRIYESTMPDVAPQLLMGDTEIVSPSGLQARGSFAPQPTAASAAAIEAVQATAPVSDAAADRLGVAAPLTPPAERQAAPAPDAVDKPWLEHRLSDIASQLSETLGASDAEMSFSEISRRLELLETRFDSALNDVATRADVEGLSQIEQYLTSLSDTFERSRRDLDRVALIEHEVMGLASRLSEDRITALGQPVSVEGPSVNYELLAEQVAARLADQTPAAPDVAPMSNDLQDMRSVLDTLVTAHRSTGEQTDTMFDTMQQAMIRLLDRMDAIETAQLSLVEHVQTAPAPQAAPAPAQAPAQAVAANEPQAIPRVQRAPADEPSPNATRAPANGGVRDDLANNTLDRIADAERVKSDRADAERATAALAAAKEAAIADAARPSTDVMRDAPEGQNAARRADFIEAARRAARRASENAINSNGPGAAPRLSAARAATAPVAANFDEATLSEDELDEHFDDEADAKPFRAAPAPAAAQGGGSRQRLWALGLVLGVVALGASGYYVAQSGGANSVASAARQLITPQTIAREQREVDEGGNWLENGGSGQTKAAGSGGVPAPAGQSSPAGAATERSLVAEGTSSSGSDDRFPLGMAVDRSARPLSDAQLAEISRGQERARLSTEAGASLPTAPTAPAALIPTEPTAPSVGGSEGQRTRSLAMMPPAMIGPSSLRVAAANGTASAEFEVGARYAEGRGVTQDFKQAAVWYERSAKQNFALAQYRLATLHERGLGVETDKNLAKYWYLKAANQGTVKAMHNLAVLTAGQGSGKPDYAGAAAWFKRAADRGLADSQFNLAILYQNGLGLPKDEVQAYKWFALAARGGDKEARVQERALAKTIDKAAKGKVDAEIAKWRPATFATLANDPNVAGRAWQAEASSS
ncbi:MAG: tetratricopeptide repeat protein [Pseudomonadota bacterium]